MPTFTILFFIMLGSFFKLGSFFSGSLHISSSGCYMLCLTFMSFFMIFLVSTNFSNYSLSTNFFFWYSFIFIFLNLCFLSMTPFVFLLGVELCVFPMIYLLFNYSKDLDKVSSTLFMFFMNIFGSVPFMIFCSSSKLMGFSSVLQTSLSSIFDSFTLVFCFLLVLLFKLPIFFTHFWLTKAHVSASGPSSMLLASLMLKLGSMGLIKFGVLSLVPFFRVCSGLLSFSTFSCLFVIFMMLNSFDLKFLVACSSILHMSMSLPLGMTFNSFGWLSVVFMAVGHGLASLILFFFLTLFYESLSSRSSDMSKTQESSSGLVMKWFFIFSFVNLGIPPFINFISELFMVSVLMELSVFSIFLAFSFMLASLFFTMMLLLKLIFGKKIKPQELMEVPTLSVLMKVYLFFLLFFTYLLN